MANVVEKHYSKTWLEISRDSDTLEISQVDGDCFHLMQRPLRAETYTRWQSITVSSGDARAFAQWIIRKTEPEPSIWDRLAAHSAVEAK